MGYMEISRGRLGSSTQYKLKDAFAGLKQKIEPTFVYAKEWTSKKLQDFGLTAQAWMNSLNANPLYQEIKHAVIETAQDPSVQDFAAKELGKVASHNPYVVNTALNIETVVNNVRTSLDNPIAHSVVEKVTKKQEGKKLHNQFEQLGQLAHGFIESLRVNALEQEIA